MQSKSLDARLAEMAEATHALIDRARRTDGRCAAAVLNLGASCTALSALASRLFELNRFLDDAVVDELLAERRSLADDLDLLASLSEASLESPDVEALGSALVRRMEKLLARENRVLYQPLIRLAASPSGDREPS